MATQSLLNSHIEQGGRTLTTLDAAGLDIRAAFWIFDEDAQAWRYSIAEPEVDVRGPRAVYEKIAAALNGNSDVVPLRDIYLVSPNDPLVTLAEKVVSTPGRGVSGISFTGNVVMGNRIPDMYIYRMYRPPIAASGP